MYLKELFKDPRIDNDDINSDIKTFTRIKGPNFRKITINSTISVSYYDIAIKIYYIGYNDYTFTFTPEEFQEYMQSKEYKTPKSLQNLEDILFKHYENCYDVENTLTKSATKI